MDDVIKYTSKFKFFDELPWLKEDMIPLLDKNFVGSRFVYLERDKSLGRRRLRRWSELTFGESYDVDLKWEEYLRHQKFVLEYFKNRSLTEFSF